jgi:SecD/SecF fusion protein
MQQKGVVKFFTVLFVLVCLFQLSFTLISYIYSGKADDYANSPVVKEMATKLSRGDAQRIESLQDSIRKSRLEYFNDSMANVPVFNILVKKYTLKDVREREINLGLDLRGGMNVTMAISVPDVIRALSGYNQDPTFNKAINLAIQKEKNSTRDFVDLFEESLKEVDPNAKLAAIFNTVELKGRINFNSSNEEVMKVIREESNAAIDRTYNILTTRIDRFGVVQPNIQKLQTAGRILIELPGIKDPERVRKLLQGTAQLEFWETRQFPELQPYFAEANKKLPILLAGGADTLQVDSTLAADTAGTAKAITGNENLTEKKDIAQAEPEKKDTAGANALLKKMEGDTASAGAKKQQESFEEYAKTNPLFAYLNPAIYQNSDGQYVAGQTAMVGRAFIKDTARVNYMLRLTKNIFPRDLKLAWTVKPGAESPDVLELVALKVTSRDGSAALGGDVITDASQDYDQNGRVEVKMSMNSEGARIWKRLTGENIGKQIAIVLDGYVYSYPNVNGEIPNGSSSITGGNMTVEEAQDLANILKAGKLPAPAHIVAEEVVGPSLGQESINAGFLSFIIAFILILIYMAFYYGRSGNVADVALLFNLFFLMGVMASINAVLTLPGIAGIVLTLAMAVDSNVIIYERMREEIRAGKGIRLVVKDGFRHAMSAIIDGHVTTILTGIVLFIFGSGPVQGFATTLVIGLTISLFSAVFIARLVFEWMLDRNIEITTGNKYTLNRFRNVNIDFLGLRKTMYIASVLVLIPGLISIVFRGLDPGLDFTGGRSFIVRFDQEVKTNEVREALRKNFGEAPEVKTFGPSNQVKITTKFMIDERSQKSDSVVGNRLFDGIKGLYRTPITQADFTSSEEGKTMGLMSSQRVDPTISFALIWKAFMAVFVSLIIIFIYIAIRFRNWQFGLGGVLALAHDTAIIIGLFSIFHGILPFNMEIDQSFIAAILTVIGYSIMDTVIIFDRIRENRTLYPKRDLGININSAINSTLGRTIMTSGTTLVSLIAIFIFGGEVLRGFTFALTFGVIIGTYSSIFVATPLAYDIYSYQERRKSKKEAEGLKKTK